MKTYRLVKIIKPQFLFLFFCKPKYAASSQLGLKDGSILSANTGSVLGENQQLEFYFPIIVRNR